MDISVIIPSFQPGEYLLEAVQSIIEQSGDFKIIEILIIDDSSLDSATLEIYELLSNKPLIKILKNQGPRGSAAARNTGLKSAQGTWIVFLDADDLLLPYSIEKRVSFLRKNPSITWCGGDFVQFSESSKSYSSPYFESRKSSYSFLLPAFDAADRTMTLTHPLSSFLQMMPASTGVIMAARSILLAAGGFDESLRMQQDVHLFLRLALFYDYGFIAEPLMANRQHARSTTRCEIETQFWRIKVFEKLLKLPEFFPYRAILSAKIAELYSGNSYVLGEKLQYKLAFFCATKALRYAPFLIASWKRLIGSLKQLIIDRH